MSWGPTEDDVLKEFIAESRGNLDELESTLLELEREPTSRALLSSLFRNAHSIKGSSSFLEFNRIETLMHAGETLLGRLRDGRLALDAAIVSVLLRLVDDVRRLVAHVETAGNEGDLDLSGTLTELERITALARPALPSEAPVRRPSEHGLPGAADGAIGVPFSHSTIRVDVGLLDRLMNLVGELVLARNQVVQSSTVSSAAFAGGPVQRLSMVTTELQGAVMKTRMQPIGGVWSRLPRVVRDVSTALGKDVRLQMEGRETELDKSIIEAIQDPLIHLVRNAVDHGIELPGIRTARGKAPHGTLTIRAFHEGGLVNIDITDDGAGLDLEQIKDRALALNLVSPERAARMTDREATNLLFLPGFTTASRVTTVSGRGVGMDVVRTNIERIGGRVDVQTEPGQSTTVRLKIPLTLAIIPALIVGSAGARYAIPQASLLEVVQLEGGQGARQIESIQGAPVFRLRGKLLPIAYLNRELGTDGAATAGESIAIVVLQADERIFGLVVDDIRDTEEIVVKPLWKRLKPLSCYAGATVMGDGRVALILDPVGLGQRVGVLSEARQSRAVAGAADAPESARPEDLILLCRLAGDSRLAIPLSRVARLEEFGSDRIEWVGGSEVAQYRGQILPLVRATRLLQERRLRPRHAGTRRGDGETVRVVVFAHDGKHVGLVVDGILDILGVTLALQRSGSREGILGTMVVQDRITEFLDVERALSVMQRSTSQGLIAADARGAG